MRYRESRLRPKNYRGTAASPATARLRLRGAGANHDAVRFRLRAMRAFDFMTVRRACALTAFAIRTMLRSGTGSASTRRAGKRLTGQVAFSQTQAGIIPMSNRKRSLNSIIPPH